MVRRCAAEQPPESVIATLASDAAALKTWRPGTVLLSEFVRTLPETFAAETAPPSLDRSFELYDEVVGAIPDDLKPAPDRNGLDTSYVTCVRPLWSSFQQPINRYLAAKAFASWTAYQGRGVSAIVRGLEAALALVRIEACRQCRGWP